MDIKRIGNVSLEEILSKIEKESIELKQLKEEKSEKNVSKEELKAAKKENRFYLPILNLNHPEMWPPKPKSERRHFTDKVAMETCLSNCCGVPGLKSACCRMDPEDLEHVLGPVEEKWIKKILKWFRNKGFELKRQDIVIDFEEGKLIGAHLFNGHRVFDDPKSYPILRFQVDGNKYCCKFLSPATGLCTINSEKSEMCRGYLCSYVKSNFLIRTKNHPNQYIAINLPEKTENT